MSLFKFFMIVDGSFSIWARIWYLIARGESTIMGYHRTFDHTAYRCSFPRRWKRFWIPSIDSRNITQNKKKTISPLLDTPSLTVFNLLHLKRITVYRSGYRIRFWLHFFLVANVIMFTVVFLSQWKGVLLLISLRYNKLCFIFCCSWWSFVKTFFSQFLL